MKQTKLIMGMPITVEIVGEEAKEADLKQAFDLFSQVDERFSPFKVSSEVSQINRGVNPQSLSPQMQQILELCDQAKAETNGYFDAYKDGQFDPSGLVKGWSVQQAAQLLKAKGFDNFYVEAGGDTALSGYSPLGDSWRVGIRNPFNINEIIKVVTLEQGAVATSGTYVRGDHIYNPRAGFQPATEMASFTVIGPDIYQADILATAAFAMGANGLNFIAQQPGYEAYQIDHNKMATYTAGFEKYVVTD